MEQNKPKAIPETGDLIKEFSLQRCSDITVIYDGKKHYFLKCILSNESDYFRGCFESFDNNILDLSNSLFPPLVLDAVFTAIYGQFKSEDIIKWLQDGKPVDILHQAACYFQFDRLKDMIEEILMCPDFESPADLDFNCLDKIFPVIKSLKDFYIYDVRDLTANITMEVSRNAIAREIRENLYKLPGYFLKELVKCSIFKLCDIQEFELFKSAWKRMKVDGRVDEAVIVKDAILDRFDFNYIQHKEAFELVKTNDDMYKIVIPKMPKMTNEYRFKLPPIFNNQLSSSHEMAINGEMHYINCSTSNQSDSLVTLSIYPPYPGSCYYCISSYNNPHHIIFNGSVTDNEVEKIGYVSALPPVIGGYVLTVKRDIHRPNEW
ncbi:hypothetical protein HDV02_004242 [Globomyces sp. JEL0801]|nr:hypothetical protein HDV02_004242 [Globomyces sp. JEL0801]